MAPAFGITVVVKPNQSLPRINGGTNPRSGGIRSRGPFLGTFLGKQKGTKHQ